jgi:hypothetical protein
VLQLWRAYIAILEETTQQPDGKKREKKKQILFSQGGIREEF